MNDEIADMTSVMSIKTTEKKFHHAPWHTHTCISTDAVLKILSQLNTNLFLLYYSSMRYDFLSIEKKLSCHMECNNKDDIKWNPTAEFIP